MLTGTMHVIEGKAIFSQIAREQFYAYITDKNSVPSILVGESSELHWKAADDSSMKLNLHQNLLLVSIH